MSNVMKCIRYFSLEGSTGIFKAERKLLVSKGTPQTDEGSFVLICRRNINLVITRKSVHKRVDLTPSTIVDELVDKGCRIIIL